MKNSAGDFLPYGKQSIDQDDLAAMASVLNSDFLTTGPAVEAFEKSLCAYTGAQYCVVVGNGTQALHLPCLAAGLGTGDYAIVPSLTFLATANAVRYCGADVIFCDVDPKTGLMRPQDLQKALDDNKGKSIKAVLPVHLTGQSVDLEPIKTLADANGLKIIADACHALGGFYKDHPVASCTYEDFATLSFHPVKALTTGEGGAILTNNLAWAERMRTLRSHGIEHTPDEGPWAYKMQEMGYNYRLSDIQCALGLSQIKKLDRFIQKRRDLAALYDEGLTPLAPSIQKPYRYEHGVSAWHLYAPRFDFKALGKSRAEFMELLRAHNIGSQVHYIPVHTQPYYTGLYGHQNLPGAQEYYEHTLSLPLFPQMQPDDVRRVVKALSDII